MAVTSIGQYEFTPRDAAEIFGANQLVYFCWDRHLLFASPFLLFVPRDMLFRDMIEERVKPLMAPDPDATAIEWDKVQWLNGPRPFTPDFDKSLTDNGIGHKHTIRMATPGLNSLMPDK